MGQPSVIKSFVFQTESFRPTGTMGGPHRTLVSLKFRSQNLQATPDQKGTEEKQHHT